MFYIFHVLFYKKRVYFYSAVLGNHNDWFSTLDKFMRLYSCGCTFLQSFPQNVVYVCILAYLIQSDLCQIVFVIILDAVTTRSQLVMCPFCTFFIPFKVF